MPTNFAGDGGGGCCAGLMEVDADGLAATGVPHPQAHVVDVRIEGLSTPAKGEGNGTGKRSSTD